MPLFSISESTVLKLGVATFPAAFNLYDSYGEVLRKLGKPDEAIENYLKLVKLNPRQRKRLENAG